MPLNPEDQRHLTAAEGYAALGMYLDANAELEEIDAEVRHVAEVLTVRLEIYLGLEKWELMQTVADRLAALDPDNVQWSISLAFATRRAQSIEAAKSILLEAVERHPKDADTPLQPCLLRVPAWGHWGGQGPAAARVQIERKVSAHGAG